ncbi:TetR/AcrR family transcriptional regulator [Acinetobacter pittii]|uniref:TetR/AcrR family transcriptional regulator n=1 Tax=Acinetobacter pittii TaxID=48296 RepID=UPI00070AE681|nr:TetR/AcrR family transcriptional regulator [Acinetobacter pittii]KRI51970.1 hypothetical protein APC53_05750 [Acinetobacter pittii]MBN6492051.1 TetR/AcrR family transcriptional regulator [Acinetobacter pittii]
MSNSPKTPTRRGRPNKTQVQIEENRAYVIKIAKDLFSLYGYEGVSMRKIAEKAEFQPSQLYTLFSNKRELLHFIWEDVFKDFSTYIKKSSNMALSSQRLEKICIATINFWLERPEDYRAIFLIQDQLQTSEDRYFVDSPQIEDILIIFKNAIVEAQKSKIIKSGDVQVITNLLICSIQGVIFNLINIPEFPWGDKENLKHLMIKTTINGLKL